MIYLLDLQYRQQRGLASLLRVYRTKHESSANRQIPWITCQVHLIRHRTSVCDPFESIELIRFDPKWLIDLLKLNMYLPKLSGVRNSTKIVETKLSTSFGCWQCLAHLPFVLGSWLRNQILSPDFFCLSFTGGLFLRQGALFTETYSNPKGSVLQTHSLFGIFVWHTMTATLRVLFFCWRNTDHPFPSSTKKGILNSTEYNSL